LFERKEGNGGAFGTLFDDDNVGTGGGLVVKLKIRNRFLILSVHLLQRCTIFLMRPRADGEIFGICYNRKTFRENNYDSGYEVPRSLLNSLVDSN
jgi:hypothetical protein